MIWILNLRRQDNTTAKTHTSLFILPKIKYYYLMFDVFIKYKFELLLCFGFIFVVHNSVYFFNYLISCYCHCHCQDSHTHILIAPKKCLIYLNINIFLFRMFSSIFNFFALFIALWFVIYLIALSYSIDIKVNPCTRFFATAVAVFFSCCSRYFTGWVLLLTLFIHCLQCCCSLCSINFDFSLNEWCARKWISWYSETKKNTQPFFWDRMNVTKFSESIVC